MLCAYVQYEFVPALNSLNLTLKSFMGFVHLGEISVIANALNDCCILHSFIVNFLDRKFVIQTAI